MDASVYLIGVDLGQAADYTAVAIAERTRVPTGEVSRMGRPKTEAHYAVRHLLSWRPIRLLTETRS
jgi:hypothetical protein